MSGHKRFFRILASVLLVGVLLSLLCVAASAAHVTPQPEKIAASLFISGIVLFFKGLLLVGLTAKDGLFIALVIASICSLFLLFIVMKRSFKQSK